MRFDWYQATLRQPVDSVLASVSEWLPDAELTESNGHNGYASRVEFRSALADLTVYHGGSGRMPPNIKATGDVSPVVAAFLRGRWPDHEVTRADCAVDFDQEGAWDRLSRHALEFADRNDIKVRHDGDFHRGLDGRTLYVGGRHSQVGLCIYEKGKQLRGKMLDAAGSDGVCSDTLAEVPESWVRVEVRVRPEGPARRAAAVMEPSDLFGCAGWSQRYARELLGLDVERVTMQVVKETDADESFRSMVNQYAKVLLTLRDRAGSWEPVFTRLRREVERSPHARKLARSSSS